MHKKNMKKLVVSVLFICFLIIFFLSVKNIKNNNYDDISIVKNIIKEQNGEIIYNGDYIYSINRINNNYIYKIYDLNGNKLYTIKNRNRLNIEIVKKKYYIITDDKYHLYNNDGEEIISAKKIESLNDYLVKVDNKIINIEKEILFKDVHTITSFNNCKYFNINNYYLIDKKGNTILENVFVSDEIKNKEVTDYLIIKKENKYYTFFLGIDKIIGDGFDSYKKNKFVYIKTGTDKYKIYKTGFRKKIETINYEIDNKYLIEEENIINSSKMFVTNKKNSNVGILNNNKFIKISVGELIKVKKINQRYYNLKINDMNYLYDIDKLKVIYKSKYNLNEIIIFDNYYKVVKDKKKYLLLDKSNNKILELNKQIIIKNKKIKIGKVNSEVYLYNIKNKKYYDAKKIKINNKNYYYYEDDIKYIVSEKFNKTYISEEYLSYNKYNIVAVNKNKIIVYNLKQQKKYEYKINKKTKVVCDYPIRNTIIINGEDYFEVLNMKLKVIKHIKNKNILKYYYNSNKGKIIIITTKKIDDYYKKGSYVAE